MAACHPSWVSGLIVAWSILVFVAEIAIGLKSHSLGPIVHGLHTLYIAVEEIICLVTQKIVPMTRSDKNTFGWARSQILGVAVNSVFLGALNFSMIISALKRFASAEHLHDPLLIVIVGAVATVADIFMLIFAQVNEKLKSKRKLRESVISQKDECEDLMSRESGTTPSELMCNKRRTLVNLMGAVVMIIAGLVRLYNDTQHWTIHADTVASLFVVSIIFVGTFPKLKNACLVLLQAAPGNMTVVELQEKLLKAVPGIINLHEFHIWQLTNEHVVATVHLCCKNGEDFTLLSDEVRKYLVKQGIHKVTIQPEFTNLSFDQFKTLHRNNSSQCELECGPNCEKSKCCIYEDPEYMNRLKRTVSCRNASGDRNGTLTRTENSLYSNERHDGHSHGNGRGHSHGHGHSRDHAHSHGGHGHSHC
ncbi:uncharacterized protein LOC141912492 [Tubulanus polymorphus]|uniref:uncharacterized protein LOC141912492 n=1 Tax=Tubulanus polymorphus TaxID=672921 RepID=UPI003DA4D88A